MMIRRTILGLVASLWSTLAMADVVMTQGAGTTIFDFTCFATKHCAAATIIDSAGATMAGAAGSPTTNALTVQGLTLGHGTAANAMRVELPTDGTGLVNAAQSGTWNVGTVATVTTLSTLTGGGAASGAADSGNPVKTGGKYNSSPITLTDGNRGDLQLDVNGYLKTNVTNANTNGQKTMANSSPVVIASDQSNLSLTPYPITAVPYTATATGTTGATTATLAGAASVTTYLCGFSIRANATAAATGNATVTGVITATLNFTQWTAPNASGLGITEMIFSPCIPASGTNQSIAIVSAAPGAGGVVSVTAWGYKL